MNLFLAEFLSLILVVLAAALCRVRDFFAAMALLSAFSGLGAVLLALLGAVDVAFTEAVVGASISTIVLMTLMQRIDSREILRREPGERLTALAALAGLAVVLGIGLHALPAFGDPAAPAAVHVAPEYIRRAPAETGTPNVVTAVLADYRGFDTMIETGVIIAAAMACVLVLRRRP